MAESSVNPNLNRNRVPEGEEVAFIRARISNLQKALDQSTHEANEALAAYEVTKIRCNAQVLILEALQSQLHTAKDTTDFLRKHALSMEEELERLRGLIHPVRRCPDDVLQAIFELVTIPDVDEEKEWGWTCGSIQLSHVCKRWRDLSLSTPRIWSYISFDTHCKSRATRSMAWAFVHRVKHIPAKIQINLHFEETSTKEAVDRIKGIPFDLIYTVPIISAINFFILGEAAPSVLLNAVNGFPSKRFDSLAIHLGSAGQGEGSIDLFISRFPPFRKLTLYEFYFGPLTTTNLDEALNGIEELDIWQISNIPLLELFQKMPKLQILKVNDCSVVLSPGIVTFNCTLLNLRSLDVGRGKLPWAQIHCPNLIQLSLGTSGIKAGHENVWEFISRTKSIKEVTLYTVNAEHLVRLAHSAAQLETLHLTHANDSSIMSVLVNWREVGLEGPPFPQLLALTLQEPSDDLRPLTLDSLIQARCFDVGHPESTMEEGIGHALKDFRIEVNLCDGREKWLGSRFLPTYFSRSGADPFEIVTDDRLGAYLVDTCFTFVENTGKACL